MFIIVGKYEKNNKDYVIERGEDKSEIVIDQIHEMQKIINLAHDPLTVIINEAQYLNVSSQNALLKTLEEPPANTTIKLYVDHEENLLPTIISRCVIDRTADNRLPTADSDSELLKLIKENNTEGGFKWAEEVKDRQEAIKIIDDLLSNKASLSVYKKLQKAKKYLRANCNVRLTLENLFIST